MYFYNLWFTFYLLCMTVVSAEDECIYVVTVYKRECGSETIGEVQDCYYDGVGQREITTKHFYAVVKRTPKIIPSRTLGRPLNHRVDFGVEINVNTKNCEVEEIKPGAIAILDAVTLISVSETNIRSIPRGIFLNMPFITELSITKSKIDYISYCAFKNLPKLLSVKLYQNNLRHWKKNWFQDCGAITTIDLSHNHIGLIESNAFDIFPHIQIINLNDNEIVEISVHAFDSLSYLDFIGLRSNRLKKFDLFYNIPVIALDLSANRLSFLSKKTIRKLKNLSLISLHYNPWNCPCLDGIEKYCDVENLDFRLAENLNNVITGIDYREYSECKNDDVPICVNLSGSRTCEANVDDQSIEKWLNASRRLGVQKYCIKL